MTPEEQRIAIAEACGWHRGPMPDGWLHRGAYAYEVKDLPDYYRDLNAVHEAESMITDDQWPKYRDLLSDLAFKASPPGAHWFRPHCCTAPQRAEAFLKTLGLWKD